MKILVVILTLNLLGACSSIPDKQDLSEDNKAFVAATLWFQKAAEARALYYQGFNVAKWRLAESLKRKPAKKLAVVVDIDETILDNSPYQASAINKNYTYPTGWKEWIAASQAKALAGALDFITFAHQKKVAVFYISNRKISGKAATIANLKSLGFPFKEDNILLRTKESSKKSRRAQVLKNYSIALLIGDNLDDFSEIFEKRSIQGRLLATDEARKEFGKKFIILPNPMYGTWLGAVYDYNWSLSVDEKVLKRKSELVEIGQ